MILAIDPGLRHLGATVATLTGHVVDAWLPRSTAKARQVAGERVPAPEGALAWRGMVLALVQDLRVRGHLERITVLAVEWPEVYRAGVKKATKKGRVYETNPNDLLQLAAVEGGIACILPALERYEEFTPRQWKKSFLKGDYQRAIVAALRPEERVLLEATPESLRHNVIESIGLAKYTATVLAGRPMSVPAFQGRAVEAVSRPVQPALPLAPSAPRERKARSAGPATEAKPKHLIPMPPSSRAGTPSYGSLHREELEKAARKKDTRHLRAFATSASYRKGDS